jgi:hypothetical protein
MASNDTLASYPENGWGKRLWPKALPPLAGMRDLFYGKSDLQACTSEHVDHEF